MAQIQDEDRCLAFIKIANRGFFLYALADDFYLQPLALDFEPIEDMQEIDLASLNADSVENFLQNYQKFIKNPAKLWADFYALFLLKASYFDLRDYGLLPSLIIDYDEKILYQTFSEFSLNYCQDIPKDWRAVLDERFFVKPYYQQKYALCFYWIQQGVDYLTLTFENKEDLF